MFVDDIGDLINPDIISNRFRTLLRKNNLKHIRFHDLRHSCASLLVASKVPMKNIQEWLGHSNFNTTADIYSHLDYSSKYESANAINQALTQTKKEKQVDDKNKQKTRQELEDEILHLQQLIKEQEEQERIEKEREEKRKQKKRQQAEM